jgi:hypothetical protein
MPDTKGPSPVDNPRYWRSRAEEAHAIAEVMRHGRTKEIMLGIARDYEKIAEMTEARLKRKPTS